MSDNEKEQRKYWNEINKLYGGGKRSLKKMSMNKYERYQLHKRAAQRKGDIKEVKRLRRVFTINSRGLGFELIENEIKVESFHFHHITKNIVVQIPSFIHRSTYHNIWVGKGMKEMNKKTLLWLLGIYEDF